MVNSDLNTLLISWNGPSTLQVTSLTGLLVSVIQQKETYMLSFLEFPFTWPSKANVLWWLRLTSFAVTSTSVTNVSPLPLSKKSLAESTWWTSGKLFTQQERLFLPPLELHSTGIETSTPRSLSKLGSVTYLPTWTWVKSSNRQRLSKISSSQDSGKCNLKILARLLSSSTTILTTIKFTSILPKKK